MDEASKLSKWSGCNIRYTLKDWLAYLIMQIVLSLLLVNVFADSIVIYAQIEKQSTIQVFFPIDGVYNEENSYRSVLSDNAGLGVKISLPLTSIDHVRIDPADEATEFVISKIELRHLFNTETYMPDDLLVRVKPLQMIDQLKLTPAGLHIRSAGNDPAFEFQFNKYSKLLQFGVLGFVSFLMSVAIFFGIKKIAHLKMPVVNSTVYLLVVPLVTSLGVAVLFYPGFMSYDTLHALRGARNVVTESMWPPMVSYIWRAVDLVSTNPSVMHFSQVFLLLGSVFYIIFFITKKIKYATLFLLIYLSIPVILGTLAVIWKDVLMAAFFMAGFAITMFLRLTSTNKWKFIFLSLLAGFLIFLGVCSRHNAITGAVPLLFYLALVVCKRLIKRPLRLWVAVISLGLTLTGVFFVTKTQLDNYSLPGLVKINNSNHVFMQSVRVLDIAGASLCVGDNLFAEMAPNLSLAEIGRLYDPKHINLSAGLFSRVGFDMNGTGVDSRVDKLWLRVAIYHPICFFNNKFQLTKYMIGANEGDQFIITAPSVIQNEYGYSLPKSSIRDSVVSYILHASKKALFKPWFLYLIAIAAFIYMVLVRALTVDYFVIFLSAVFYFTGLVLFGNAADARLLFYTTTALLVFIITSISAFEKRHK